MSTLTIFALALSFITGFLLFFVAAVKSAYAYDAHKTRQSLVWAGLAVLLVSALSTALIEGISHE